jgi:hypothetical protein
MIEEYLGYNIVSGEGPESRFKRIKPIGKGSIPTVLTGLYTTALEAKKAIDTQKAKSKVKANATKQSNG